MPLRSCPLRLLPNVCFQEEDIRRVANGFVHNYRWNGYRDVKVHVVVERHLCEIQLHLSSFYILKDGQHQAYEWSRILPVTVDIDSTHLFRNVGPEILEEMIRLAQHDWRSTRYTLPALLYAAGRYSEARSMYLDVSTL